MSQLSTVGGGGGGDNVPAPCCHYSALSEGVYLDCVTAVEHTCHFMWS